MKAYLAATALVAMSAVTASAADIAARPIYNKAPAAQVYDWTGFYAGVNVGGGVGRSRTSFRDPIPTNENETTYLSATGVIGGAQIGYNWQFRNFYNLVLGVEADIQGSGQQGSACIAGCNNSGVSTVTAQQTIDWFGTIRGRAGLANGPVLTYFTGGFAYGHVNTSGSLTGAAPPSLPYAFGETRGGYVIGSGIEASLGGKWTGKLEYLYVDLGTSSATIVTAGNANAAAFFGSPISASSRVRDNIFRAGLNYGIGGDSGYVPPVANWRGAYVGANFGSQVARNQSTYAIGDVTFSTGPNNNQFSLMPDGYAGGLQIGYNWQSGAWVYGVEADFQGSTSKDNKTCILGCAINSATAAFNQTVPYFGTVRGRLGYTIGSTLFYGTGGYAFGQTKTIISDSAFGGPVQTISLSDTRSGYAVGGGIESPLQLLSLFGPNWTAKAEYLLVDLGRTSNSFVSTPFFGGLDTFTTRTQEHMFRTGINYHFQ